MLDIFLKKYFKIVRIVCIVLQLFIVAFYVLYGSQSLNQRLVVMAMAPGMFIIGIVVTSILLGLQAIITNIPKRTFLVSCYSFMISCLIGYILFMIEFKTGNDKLAVLASSAIIGVFLTTVFIKNWYADHK